ncbi:MAG: DSD1 family PLP-dependent enzyme [Hyphomonadaceae bacterium]
MNDRDLHGRLIGQQGGREAFNTPVLVIDLDRLERNISAMAAFAKAHGVALRPHAKTHKSVDIARLQKQAGAVGNCCAKLGEAETLAEGGIDSILITSPVVSAPAIARLAALNEKIRDLRVVVDNPRNLADLAQAAATGRPLQIVIDIDPGIRRTGVRDAAAAVEIAAAATAAPAINYLGVQFYCGREQHVEAFKDRREALQDRTAFLREVIAALTAEGYPPGVVTGGGTGTHLIDVELGVLNELQVGSYVFMDRQYNDCEIAPDGSPVFETSLFVDARVVSANTPGMATIDSGFKALATDGGPPAIASGAPEASIFHFMGDEHAALVSPDDRFEIGTRVSLVVPHCDPTVNLYDFYHVVRGDTLVDIWPVSARGASR